MIKINLLPQRRAKLRASASSEGGQKEMAIGLASLAGAAALVFFVLDQPKRSKVHDINAAKAEMQTEINAKNKQLDGFAEINKAYTQASERARSINRLIAAKVVPANVLEELGQILTAGQWPTMTKQMARRTGSG